MEGMEVIHPLLTLALDGDQWSTSVLGRFNPPPPPLVAVVLTEQNAVWAPEPVWTFQRWK
jgi:hypothetical protein